MCSIFKLIDNESKYYTIYLSTFTKDVEDNTMEQIEHYIANCEDPTSKFWQTREDVKIEFLGGFTIYGELFMLNFLIKRRFFSTQL